VHELLVREVHQVVHDIDARLPRATQGDPDDPAEF
jgi:hypothetical protein